MRRSRSWIGKPAKPCRRSGALGATPVNSIRRTALPSTPRGMSTSPKTAAAGFRSSRSPANSPANDEQEGVTALVALKTAEIDKFLARPDPARPVVLVFGPDAGLVRE